jgi:formylglycine-generating enzyme required for sulfatase activity/tRNA A-37 threonylcarbamoyl transferase component Bud32
MAAGPISHPSPDVLHALAAGRLDQATAHAIIAHIEACPDCQRAATTIGEDSFLRRHPAAETAPSGGTLGPAAAAGAAEAIPPELRDHPDFEVLRKLGGGGMGVVYLARDRLTHRQEVLKVINPSLATQAGAAERFLREIRAVVQLLHPNIVNAYGALQLGDLLVLKMEYVPGQGLDAVVKAGGPLPVVNACYYAQQVAVGLQYAFGKGMIHRDVKPGNLILARDGQKHVVKILDFGLAKARREGEGTSCDLTHRGQVLGTPAYMAPEQAEDATGADIRADVYSLGCTLYYFLAGRPPFQAKNLYALLRAHASQEAAPLHELRQDVPAGLAAVVAKMLAKDPARRYQEPSQVADALKPFVKTGGRIPPKNTGPRGPNPADDLVARVKIESAIDLVPIPSGSFYMGSPKDDKAAWDDEKPQHKVTISHPFYLGKFHVTIGQFKRFIEATGHKTEAETGGDDSTWKKPGFDQSDAHPVVRLSWNDADAFCQWLAKESGATVRLPCEAEWEYSCRAVRDAKRPTTKFYFGDEESKLGDYAWYKENSGATTHPCGQKTPNAFGLFDMHGLVYEWCADGPRKYEDRDETDPLGPTDARASRVYRGGSFAGVARYCRAAYRNDFIAPSFRNVSLGFRVLVSR